MGHKERVRKKREEEGARGAEVKLPLLKIKKVSKQCLGGEKGERGGRPNPRSAIGGLCLTGLGVKKRTTVRGTSA